MTSFDVNELLRSLFNEDTTPDARTIFDKKLIEYNLSKTKALKLLSIDKDVFEEIISGKAKQPNLIHIVKIAEFLSVDINQFIHIVLKNQSSENISSIDSARKATFLLKNFDVKTLTKMGFFDSDDDVDKLISRVLNYFGFESIQEFEQQLDEPLYSRAKRNFSDKMKDFWIKSAYRAFKIINNPNPYDRQRLKDLVVKIKPYSQDLKDGLLTVSKALYHVGVTVIFQNYLSTTLVKGATFVIDGKPCIVLTDYNKKYPTLWFTLLHELHHVLFDFTTIETNKFHLTGDDDLFLIEEKADAFARDFFLSAEKFHYIKSYINNSFIVNKFAKDNEIHPSLVYSFFGWYQDKLYGKNYHAAFKEHYPDYREAIKRLNPVMWDDISIRITSQKIRDILELKS